MSTTTFGAITLVALTHPLQACLICVIVARLVTDLFRGAARRDDGRRAPVALPGRPRVADAHRPDVPPVAARPAPGAIADARLVV